MCRLRDFLGELSGRGVGKGGNAREGDRPVNEGG